jgi:heterodisulfide reductase subunit A2
MMKRGQALQESAEPRLGIFLCECGAEIAPRVDLEALARLAAGSPEVAQVEILPYSCLAPGLARIQEMVRKKALNRVIVAGCESRLLHKKFEQALEDLGIAEAQIELINLRDHVARVHPGDPTALAAKGAKLIRASQAWLETLQPTPRLRIDFEGPVLILGDGIAAYGAAQELADQGVEAILARHHNLAEKKEQACQLYPGEFHTYKRLWRVMDEVEASPRIQKAKVGELKEVSGRFGDYTVTFFSADKQEFQVLKGGAIIAALDWEISHQLPEWGHDGDRVICHLEMNDLLRQGAPLKGPVVFGSTISWPASPSGCSFP